MHNSRQKNRAGSALGSVQINRHVTEWVGKGHANRDFSVTYFLDAPLQDEDKNDRNDDAEEDASDESESDNAESLEEDDEQMSVATPQSSSSQESEVRDNEASADGAFQEEGSS